MRGFTLIELTIVILITGIIVGFGIPSLGGIRDRLETDRAKGLMMQTLNQARSWALSNSKPVIVCPLKNRQCSSDWTDPLTILHDQNEDLVLDNTDTIISQVVDHSNLGIWMKKRPTQNFVKFTRQGHAFSSATTFIYCPNSKNFDNARQIVISFQGRIRSNYYLSSRGTPYASLNPLECQ